MKILSADQIRAWDQFTIQSKPISSYDLMEHASETFSYWFSNIYDSERNVYVFCGTGNNGGDGLAIARLLHYHFFNVSVYICHLSPNKTDDFNKNLDALPPRADLLKGQFNEGDSFPAIPQGAIIIDAILGSGLSHPVEGYWASFFKHLNDSSAEIVSVDIPSGLFSDAHTFQRGGVIEADKVLSFEIPKLAFFMPENYRYIKEFNFKSIGLSPSFLETIPPYNVYVTQDLITTFYKKRSKFAHKGTYGHALLVCGCKGMAGAAILSARACLRSGVGLLTIHTPQYNREIVQMAVPEAICREDSIPDVVTHIEDALDFTTVGIGCGIGKDKRTVKALKDLLKKDNKPMVIDADALNILSENKELIDLIPENSILTPHPKEFQRLFGASDNDFDRLELLRNRAKTLKINILIKGAYTVIANTEGVCFFNSTGNPGMATAGSGDVLTGLITGLLAQGYEPSQAAILGVYLHGLAGDLAAEKVGEEALIAGDIIQNLGQAFLSLVRE